MILKARPASGSLSSGFLVIICSGSSTAVPCIPTIADQFCCFRMCSGFYSCCSNSDNSKVHQPTNRASGACARLNYNRPLGRLVVRHMSGPWGVSQRRRESWAERGFWALATYIEFVSSEAVCSATLDAQKCLQAGKFGSFGTSPSRASRLSSLQVSLCFHRCTTHRLG